VTRGLVAALLLILLAPAAFAGEARIAVAANFAPAARSLASAFEAADGARVTLSFGSTGALYLQIRQGAPFGALLAADQARPARLAREGLAIAESRFTYAIGALALYRREPDLPIGPDVLKAGAFARIAIANPDVAPYGAAAMAALGALGLAETLAPRIVRGKSVAQALQFVESGAAPLGFVALSLIEGGGAARGARWVVPADLHPPIAQDAILIDGADETSKRFLHYIRSPAGRALIERAGYRLP